MKAFKLYRKSRTITSGLLFKHASGETISRNFLAKILKQCISVLGKNQQQYKTHSFRIGKASDMAKGVTLMHRSN